MENKSFFSEYKAYLILGVIFGLLTYWYFWLSTIADLPYIFKFILEIMQGNFTGQVVPYESLTAHEQMETKLFGPNYNAIAPEVVRAFEERQHILPIMEPIIIGIIAVLFLVKGRKQAKITKDSKKVIVYSVFQRTMLLLNILIMIYLVVTGFSITFGNSTGGGYIPRLMRATHEIVGLGWIPVWLIMTVIAFKDHKHFHKPMANVWNKVFLRGKYTHLKRIYYFAYVAFGTLLVVSGFVLWNIYPDASINAETIQLRRLLLFVHFMGSTLILVFSFATIYSYFVSVKGYLPGVFTGKLPVEYLEQLTPDILDEEDLRK